MTDTVHPFSTRVGIPPITELHHEEIPSSNRSGDRIPNGTWTSLTHKRTLNSFALAVPLGEPLCR